MFYSRCIRRPLDLEALSLAKKSRLIVQYIRYMSRLQAVLVIIYLTKNLERYVRLVMLCSVKGREKETVRRSRSAVVLCLQFFFLLLPIIVSYGLFTSYFLYLRNE